MRFDDDLGHDIANALDWDPSLCGGAVAVAVRAGIVTLAGYVESFAGKWTAERVAGSVRGVKAIVNDIAVTLPPSSQRPDPAIAAAAVHALEWNVLVPHERVKATVDRGWITLNGNVDWYYQKEHAEKAVRRLTGVKGVTNLVAVHAGPASTQVKHAIKEALRRNADLHTERIAIEVNGNRVILRGAVRSYTEFRVAEYAVRSARGVTDVENDLRVEVATFTTV